MVDENAKQHLRQKMKAVRAEKAPEFSDAASQAKDIFLCHFSNFTKIALYYPMRDELSTLPLMKHLQDLDQVICLPQVTADELVFRKWEGEPLQQSQYNFLEPSSDLPQIIPDLVVVPLLAFDNKGHRLGYGKGHYDRMLHYLRQRHNLTTVGYAYSFQEVAEIPQEPHDEKLDYIVTEKALLKI